MKTNLLRCLSSGYFVNQPLHVSGIFVAYHQEVYCTYTIIGTCCAFCWLSVGRVGKELKHVEADWQGKLKINSASSWFSLHCVFDVQLFVYCTVYRTVTGDVMQSIYFPIDWSQIAAIRHRSLHLLKVLLKWISNLQTTFLTMDARSCQLRSRPKWE